MMVRAQASTRRMSTTPPGATLAAARRRGSGCPLTPASSRSASWQRWGLACQACAQHLLSAPAGIAASMEA